MHGKTRTSKKKKSFNPKPFKSKGFKHRRIKKSDILKNEIFELTKKYKEIRAEEVQKFTDLPLCSKTKKGLENGKYEIPTEIQRQSIGLALQGHDILGAAKTGSGKTLAFLIPVLEQLFVQKWTPMDGLGALIISPTRELAYQIFNVLRVVGKFHDFSAGLVIGGKHLREESEKINNTNVIICTPGRLLQHMDQTFNFSADNLQILVLDEADRILDMGFKDTMNAIIQNLPPKRQTLLFSATQTRSVKDLARLSLKDPMFVSVHENAAHSTPTHLTQSYIVCELHQKMDMLWSFIRNHLKMKTLVFLSSCKQVRFVYEALRRMRPGVPVMCLHGAMQQMKRVAVYDNFKNKKYAVLLATDIAARGLDFPAVHWVIQLDCPEDANTYIHRVGRTARYEENGEALLVLLPCEAKMIEHLEEKKIPIEKILINREKLNSVQGKVAALCAAELELKQFAQRAFVSYLKAIFFMKDKEVFDVSKLDTDSYARSLGLAVVPRVRFLEKKERNMPKKENETSNNKTEKVASGSAEKSINPKNSESDNDSLSDSDSGDESPTKGGGVDDSGRERTKDERESVSNNRAGSESSDSESEAAGSESSDRESEAAGSASSDSESEAAGSESSDIESEESSSKSGTVKANADDRDSAQNEQDNAPDEPEVFSFGLAADDEEDDLLTLKRDGSTVKEEDLQLLNVTEHTQRKKTLSKAALAKKLMKKKITVNEKVLFDEEGKEICDVLKKSQIQDEGEINEGGIDIKEARERMRKEDAIDKAIYRERIQKKHKEERIKAKERRRKNPKQKVDEEEDEGAVAVLGSGTESGAEWRSDESGSSESGSEAGSRSTDDEAGRSQSEESESDDDRPPVKKARKSKLVTAANRYETGRSLEDDEMMALHLLSGGL